jgi:hypothetical protein
MSSSDKPTDITFEKENMCSSVSSSNSSSPSSTPPMTPTSSANNTNTIPFSPSLTTNANTNINTNTNTDINSTTSTVNSKITSSASTSDTKENVDKSKDVVEKGEVSSSELKNPSIEEVVKEEKKFISNVPTAQPQNVKPKQASLLSFLKKSSPVVQSQVTNTENITKPKIVQTLLQVPTESIKNSQETSENLSVSQEKLDNSARHIGLTEETKPAIQPKQITLPFFKNKNINQLPAQDAKKASNISSAVEQTSSLHNAPEISTSSSSSNKPQSTLPLKKVTSIFTSSVKQSSSLVSTSTSTSASASASSVVLGNTEIAIKKRFCAFSLNDAYIILICLFCFVSNAELFEGDEWGENDDVLYYFLFTVNLFERNHFLNKIRKKKLVPKKKYFLLKK